MTNEIMTDTSNLTISGDGTLDIETMARRFLQWQLPENFDSDNGITFIKFGNKGTSYQYKRIPTGTNLLSYDQAIEMIKYITNTGAK